MKEEYARIGVMPRYGDADSIKWFNIETHCIFHIFNCFEDGDDEVFNICIVDNTIARNKKVYISKCKWL